MSSACCAGLCSTALAQDLAEKRLPGLKHPVLCHAGDPTMCAIELEAGEQAPFAGVLQSMRQAAASSVRADPAELQKRLSAAVEFQKRQDDVGLEQEKLLRSIDNKAWADKERAAEESHRRQLDLVKPRWYETPWFVSAITAIVVLGVVGAGVAVACELQGCGPE